MTVTIQVLVVGVLIVLAHVGGGIGLIALIHNRMGRGNSHESVETDGLTIHWARWYDPFWALVTLGRAQSIRKMSLDHVNIQPTDHVLDVGCGTGQLTKVINERVGQFGRVVGIDPAIEMVETARKKNAGVDFRLAAVENLPFDDGSFDLITSSLVLHHLPDSLKPAAFQEMARVLKPNGRAVHIDFAAGGHTPKESWKKMIRSEAIEAGFSDVTIGKTDFKLLSVIEMKK